MTDNDDAAREQVLREALRSGADYRQASDADWTAFVKRGASRGTAWSRWRVPLVAAGSVAVLATGITAVATGGFGAVSDSATSLAPHELPVPISTEYYTALDLDAARADGTTPQARRVDPAAPEPQPAGVDLPAAPLLWMSFSGGEPPAAGLSARIQLADGSATAAGGVDTPSSGFGYLTWSTPGADGVTYLWGAVGPEVAQLQIEAPLDDADSAVWFFTTGNPPTAGVPAGAATAATFLQGDWYGFAVELPPATRTVHLWATNVPDGLIQARTVDLAAGTIADDAFDAGPGMSAGPSGAEAPGNVKTQAPPVPGVDAGTIQTAAQCAGSGRLSDSTTGDSPLRGAGFDGGDLRITAGDDVVCFFDGRSWWAATPLSAQLAALRITDIGDGPPPAADAPQDRATRFVFGLAGADVTAVHATVDGGIYTPLVGPAFGSSVRVFVIPVPAHGDVAVIANGADGAALESVTFPDSEPAATRPSANGETAPYAGTYPDPNEGMQALEIGTVNVLNGCVVIVASDTGAVTLPVFPASQVEPAAAPAVLRYRGHDYAAGDPISLAGGHRGTPVPSRCGDDTFLVNPFD